MEHKDILLVFKEHYAEVLEKIKSKIDKNGILPKNNINNIKNRINTLDELINNEVDDELELLGLDIDKPEDRLIHKDMKAIMNSRSLNFDVDNEEYNMMK